MPDEGPSFRDLMHQLTHATGDQAGRLIKLEAMLEGLRRDHDVAQRKIDECIMEIHEIKNARSRMIGYLIGAGGAGGGIGALLNKIFGGQ